MRPLRDQVIHVLPDIKFGSGRFKTRITRGNSVVGGLDTLQTLRSPSAVCVASMSDFCLEDEACQASAEIGDGALEVVRVCNIVNDG